MGSFIAWMKLLSNKNVSISSSTIMQSVVHPNLIFAYDKASKLTYLKDSDMVHSFGTIEFDEKLNLRTTVTQIQKLSCTKSGFVVLL